MIVWYHFGQIQIASLDFYCFDLYLFVSPFFFFSGYGLTYSLQNKEKYLDTFIQKRFPQIIVPYIVMLLLVGLLIFVLTGNSIYSSFIFNFDAFPYHWFVFQLLAFYLIFFISFVCFKKYVLVVISILMYSSMVLLATFTAPFYNLPTIYFAQGTWAFLLGIMWCLFAVKINNFTKKKYLPLFTALLILFIFYDPFYLTDFIHTTNLIFFGTWTGLIRTVQVFIFMFIVLMLMQIKSKRSLVLGCVIVISVVIFSLFLPIYNANEFILHENRKLLLILLSIIVFSKIMTNISFMEQLSLYTYEIYLTHQPILLYFQKYTNDSQSILFFLIMLLIITLTSYVTYRISKKIINFYFIKLEEIQSGKNPWIHPKKPSS